MADALSRHSVNTLSADIDFLTMARDQISENVAAEVADSSLVLDWVSLGDSEVKLLCDISQGKARPVVPDSWIRRIFDLLDGLSHPSVRNTKKIISAKFVWPHIKKQHKLEHGLKLVYPVKLPKPLDIPKLPQHTSLFQTGNLTTSMWTLWDHYLPHKSFSSFSLLWIEPLDGPKLFL